MKHTFVFLATLLLIVSCKKEKKELPVTPEDPVNAFEVPTSVGSYWIYQWDEIDSNGVCTPQTYTDTIRIIDDTLINNQLYAVYEGTLFGNNEMQWYERDSSGYIVNSNGKIICAYSGSPQEFYQIQFDPYEQFFGVAEPGTITVPTGTYQNAVRMYDGFRRIDGQPVNSCSESDLKLYSHYVSGIGLVSRETGFFGMVLQQCKFRRSKLVEYYIAP